VDRSLYKFQPLQSGRLGLGPTIHLLDLDLFTNTKKQDQMPYLDFDEPVRSKALFLQEFLAEILDFNTLVLGQGPTYRLFNTVPHQPPSSPTLLPQGRRVQIVLND